MRIDRFFLLPIIINFTPLSIKTYKFEMKEMWNERYSAASYAYGTEPNTFFAETLVNYKPTGNLLLPAEGEGRNAVFAAKNGLNVTAFDISEAGKVKAMALAAANNVSIGYEVGDFLKMNFERSSFDSTALIYAHFPPALLSIYHQRIVALLNPNGLILLEGFSTNNLPYREANPKIGGPDKIEMLFSVEKIKNEFPTLEIIQLEEVEVELNEGLYHQGKGKVIRFVGRKKA